MLLLVPEILLVKHRDLRHHPRVLVDDVGNAGDWHLMVGDVVPYIFPDRAAHLAMQFADAIGMAARAQSQDSHAKRFDWIDARLAEPEKLLERKAKLRREIAEVAFHHFPR